MFCILYQFNVKLEFEKEFVESWKGLTKETYKNEGSLGSRLHKVSDSEFIAYAQWPSKEAYDSANNMSEAALKYRNQMRACCESIEVLHKMEMVEDLLVKEVLVGSPLFVVYGATVHVEKQVEYRKGWKGLTELIHKYEGSLGSRLHKVSDEFYLAYAQWPSKEVFKNAGVNMPVKADKYRALMNEGCEKFETLYEMELISDLLKTTFFLTQ